MLLPVLLESSIDFTTKDSDNKKGVTLAGTPQKKRSMTGKDTKYLQFPLLYMREFFTAPDDAIDKIIPIGIYKFALSIKDFTADQVARQTIYEYNVGTLPEEISGYLHEAGLIRDTDYRGFGSGTYDPETQLPDLITMFENDPGFLKRCEMFYRIHQAIRFYGGDAKTSYILTEGERLLQQVPAGEPWPMVPVDSITGVLDDDISGFDLHLLAAYVGIRSIIGVRSYARTNDKMVVARMFGYINHKAMQADTLTPDVKELVNKYSTRYWIEKILLRMQTKFGLLKYSYHGLHGYYVGVASKITLQSLAEADTAKKEKVIARKLKEANKAARSASIQHLNKEHHLNKVTANNNCETNEIQHTLQHTLQHLNKYINKGIL